MGFLGHHSSYPGGNPADLSKFDLVRQAALGGNRAAAQWLRDAAAGKTVSSVVPGVTDFQQPSGKLTWGGGDEGNTAEQTYLKDIVSGNTTALPGLAKHAQDVGKAWEGGWGADLLPAAAAFIPGVGPIAAAAIGAGIGGLSAAGGLTNRSVLAGLGQGALTAGAGAAAKAALARTAAMGAGGIAKAALPLAARAAAGGQPLAAPSGLAGIVPAVAGAAGGNNPLINDISQAVGTFQGAQQLSRAADYRKAAVDAAQQDWAARAPLRQTAIDRLSGPQPTAPDLSSVFSNTDNPFARDPNSVARAALVNPGTAAAAANAALRMPRIAKAA